ncbi:BREX-2 system phosphatase PglZ [Nocardia sp. NPDC058499]|uniref:BREX-2 system phosphatase PglZ n=1 Tax=Nocardia sp. NPDC058499 TaxID=3346530 RepID=UPI00364B3825
MTVSAGGTALRLAGNTIAQYLGTRAGLAGSLHGSGAQVLLLRGEPLWDGDADLPVGEGRARIIVAPSPLAVHEQVLTHTSGSRSGLLVVLTDAEEQELDPAILVRSYRGRIHAVDRWEIVAEAFGATTVDAGLKREEWACEALLDAAGPTGWRATAPTAVLGREHALAALAIRRLRLDTTGRIDPETLLAWSQRPGMPELLTTLRPAECEGLSGFLGEAEQGGATGRVLTALIRAGHGAESLAYGLLCAALWQHASADSDTYRARGRMERWLGEPPPTAGAALDAVLAGYGTTCENYLRIQLTRARIPADDPDGGPDRVVQEARRITDTALRQAETLVRQFGAQSAAAASPTLRSGLDALFTAAGTALIRDAPEEIDAAVRALRAHACTPDHRTRFRRVVMAARLSRWLATEPDPTADSVASALHRQMTDTAWADRALDYLEAGGDDDPGLRMAFTALADRVRTLRREFDYEFSRTLAGWTSSGAAPGELLTVEDFLDRVVAPVAADRRVLLIVIDGMSAAIATRIAQQMPANFSEFDPHPTPAPPGHRRAMAAALPSLTAVSRTSLFAGKLTQGDQDDEKRLFPKHPFRGSRAAAVFHKNDLRAAEAGDQFGPELLTALNDPGTHVAVVLNTVDDRLAKEHKPDDADWRIEEIGDLQALLTIAAAQEMTVLITSDHGHVIDRHGVKVDGTGVGSARHRIAAAPDRLGETEVTLSGPRVVWDGRSGASIVALWDTDSRYTAQKAGYHGGAALAEITIPILAYAPFGTKPPNGKQILAERAPDWWTGEVPDLPAPPVPTAQTRRATNRRIAENSTDQMSFEIPAESPGIVSAGTASEDLVDRLLASEVYEVQLGQPARKPPAAKIEAAIRALLEGPQPITALAQRAGHPVARAAGFAAILKQVLNVDSIEVLEPLKDGRTLRLNTKLLREQFEL